MKKAIFVGDPQFDGEGPKTIKHRGKVYVKGEETEVTDAEAAALAGHSHFAVLDGPSKTPTKEPAKEK